MLPLVQYHIAEKAIKEGDVLLFRGQGLISSLIQKAGGSIYSHVGVASWANNILECVEFREWKGGRAVNLAKYVEQNDGLIDVYRPTEYFGSYEFNPSTLEAKYIRRKFNGKLVTNTMRKMTGLPYGWNRILWLSKFKLAGIRLFYKYDDLTCDALHDIVYPVCSTSVGYSFNYNNFDLVLNKSDESLEPGDIARSARIIGLMTLCT